MTATFDDLDLNDQYARETVYYDRVRAEFEGQSDDVVFAGAQALRPHKTYGAGDRWYAVRDIAELRILRARQVEPKMETFSKVRAGWYSLAVVHWRTVLDQIGRVPEHERAKELSIDVSKYGDEWMVSVRGSEYGNRETSRLNQHSLHAQPVLSLADGRRFAVALKAYLTNKGPHPDFMLKIFSDERDAAHRAEMEKITGKPYDEWEAEMNARYSK